MLGMITLFLGIGGHADKFSGRLCKQLHDKFWLFADSASQYIYLSN